ncbi:hypothetical protein [Flavobacterium filum]|uniref:hypothetical protein n=1 Tax=Flavobacterium filum TaxID=370974 RepID=UPI0023F57C96|nr:hypothetical protein [Flavobacterium filum]
MKSIKITHSICFISLFLISFFDGLAQSNPPKPSPFWSKVRYGGGLGLNIGNNFTDIFIAPSAIYDVNQYLSVGVGLQGSYIKQRNIFDSYLYGGSLIGLVNPTDFLQFSTEIEQLRVNTTYKNTFDSTKSNFWNTGVFLGAGYVNENVTIGVRYNILHNNKNNLYSEAWMPFVRVYF